MITVDFTHASQTYRIENDSGRLLVSADEMSEILPELSKHRRPIDPSFENGILRRALKGYGFRIIEGDYVMKDGSKSPLFVAPQDPAKIVKALARAIEDQVVQSG